MRSPRKIAARMLRRARRLAGYPAGPAILMYHRIARPSFDPWELAVSPENFEGQLDWLKQRRTVLPMEEFAALQKRGKLPGDAVAITFDDGYACNAQIAAPLAAAKKAPITIFLTTGAVSSANEFWWDDLERILTAAPPMTLEVTLAGEDLSFDLQEASGPLTGARADAYNALWGALRRLDIPTCKAALKALARQCGAPEEGRPEYSAMSRAELDELVRSEWVTIGAHSVNHPPLSELSPEDQRFEIETSRDACAEFTGAVPALFAYPYGDYDDRTVELVGRAGFETAVTTDAGFVSKGSESLRLPRLQVGDWPAERFSRMFVS